MILGLPFQRGECYGGIGAVKGKVFSSAQKVRSGWANLHFYSVVNNVETLLIFCLLNLSGIKVDNFDLSFYFYLYIFH